MNVGNLLVSEQAESLNYIISGYHRRISDATNWDTSLECLDRLSIPEVLFWSFIFRVHFTVSANITWLSSSIVYIHFALNFDLIFSFLLCFSRLSGALEDGAATMPDMFVSKYNKFVDGIFERINGILKKSYDPVNVQLNNEGAEVKSTTGHKKSHKKFVWPNNQQCTNLILF